MKKVLLNVILIFFIASNVFSQNQGQAVYIIKPPNNLDSIFSKLDKEKKAIMINSYQKINNFIEQQTFKLKFKNGISHFKIEDKLESDLNIANLKFVKNIYPENYYYHRNKTNFYIKLNFNKSGYLVKVDDSAFKVTLHSDKYNKVINGYSCSLATLKSITNHDSEYVYNIWYAKEYNLPFGPSIYNGLPGLVVQVKEPSGNIIELQDLKFSDQSEITINNQLIEIAEKEFNNIIKKSLNKFKPN